MCARHKWGRPTHLTAGVGLKSEVQHRAQGKVSRCKAETRTDSFSLRIA
jgi:hypothetical protein